MNNQIPLFPDMGAVNDRSSTSVSKKVSPASNGDHHEFADSMREAEKQVKTETAESNLQKKTSPPSNSQVEKNESSSVTKVETTEKNATEKAATSETSAPGIDNPMLLTDQENLNNDSFLNSGQWFFPESMKLNSLSLDDRTMTQAAEAILDDSVDIASPLLNGHILPQAEVAQMNNRGLANNGMMGPLLPKEMTKAASQIFNVEMDVNTNVSASTHNANLLATTKQGMSANVLAGNTNLDKQIVQQAVIQASAIESSSALVNQESPQANFTQSHLVGTTVPTKPQLLVNTPFQQSQWGQAVAEKVVWMNHQGLQEAEIHMDPPELGPIQVKVSVSNEQAQVSFVVQHTTVKESLDQSAMRLREMFEGEGLDLVNVDVSDQSQQQENDESDTPASGPLLTVDNEEIVGETPLSTHADGYSLVDDYA